MYLRQAIAWSASLRTLLSQAVRKATSWKSELLRPQVKRLSPRKKPGVIRLFAYSISWAKRAGSVTPQYLCDEKLIT